MLVQLFGWWSWRRGRELRWGRKRLPRR